MAPSSAAQERYDRARRTAGIFLGPLVFVAVLLAPLDLPPAAHRLAAVFGLVIVFWISEAIPLAATALLGPALTVPLGVAPASAAFAPFGNPIIFLFLGSFLIAAAMRTHGLDRRMALFVLSRAWVGESPARILFAFGAIAAFLSMWMSNTATAAMMLPIGIGVLAALGHGGTERPYATGLMLMIAFGSSIGGIATPVGTPPNLIAIGMIQQLLGRRIGFFEWMTFALPIALVLFALAFVLLWRLFRMEAGELAGASVTVRAERAKLGRLGAGEKASLAAFALAVVLWTAPGLASLLLGADHSISQALGRVLPDEGSSAILAATFLFLFPVDWRARRFALEWRQAVSVDWGTILLFGGGLSLGSLAFSTGLAEALGNAVVSSTGSLPLSVVTLAAVFLGAAMTEVMSNTATANLLVPTFIALAGEATGDRLLPTLGVTLGCSLAFCLPVATPPNAVVYGSGQVPLWQMVRAGVLLDLGCGVLTWAGLLVFIR